MSPRQATLFHRHKDIFIVRLVRFVLLPLFILFAGNAISHNAGTALAGGITRSCDSLIVFEGANVNNYIKQFSGVTDSRSSFDEAGKMLALLVQLDGLYSQIGYGSLGYVYIKTDGDDSPSCSNKQILERIKGERCCSSGKLQDGKAALLLSGHFQRVKDRIYLLTSVEFLRKEMEETVSVPSFAAENTQTSFITQMPRVTVSFTPRKFTRQQLDQVANDYSDIMYVRRKPSLDEQPFKLEPFDVDGFSYYIEEVKTDWIKIRSYGYRLPSGWVKVPHDIGGLGLRELLPELYFMDATAVYLQTRIAGPALSPKRYNRHLKKFESLMKKFAERIQGTGDRRALGFLKSMYAALLLERPGPGLTKKEIKQISTVAAEAADLLPTSSQARSLAALTRFASMSRTDVSSFPVSASTLEKDLLQVLSADPANIYVKSNLEQLWRLRTVKDTSKSNWQNKKLTALRARFLGDAKVRKLIRKQPFLKDKRIQQPVEKKKLKDGI